MLCNGAIQATLHFTSFARKPLFHNLNKTTIDRILARRAVTFWNRAKF